MKKEFWMKKSFVRKHIREALVDEIFDLVEGCYPQWSKPWVSYSPEKDSLYISLTEEDSYDKYLRWRDFVKILTGSDKEVLKVLLPKLEKLCVDIRRVLEG